MKVKASEVIAMFAAAGMEGTDTWTAKKAGMQLGKLEKLAEDDGAMKKLKKDKVGFNLFTALMKAAEEEKDIDLKDDLAEVKKGKKEAPAKKGKGKAKDEEEEDDDEEGEEEESEDEDESEEDEDEDEGDDEDEEDSEDEDEEEEKPVKGKKGKKVAKPAKKGKKAKDEDEEEEEDDDEEETPKKKKKGKKAAKKDAIETDAYGSRIKDGEGKTTRAHKINSVFLASKDSFTAAEVQKKAKYSGPVHGHLRHLIEADVIKKKDDGKYKRIRTSLAS